MGLMELMGTHIFHQHRTEHSPPLLPPHHCTAPNLKPVRDPRPGFSKAEALLRTDWGCPLAAPGVAGKGEAPGRWESWRPSNWAMEGRGGGGGHRETHPGQSWLFPGAG